MIFKTCLFASNGRRRLEQFVELGQPLIVFLVLTARSQVPHVERVLFTTQFVDIFWFPKRDFQLNIIQVSQQTKNAYSASPVLSVYVPNFESSNRHHSNKRVVLELAHAHVLNTRVIYEN